MRLSLVLVCVLSGTCVAQPGNDLAPEWLTLAKIKVHMGEMLRRQPNYTCTEQIERTRRRPPRFKYELLDMVRLEVALVEGKELFAWPGSKKFEEGEIERLVPTGGAMGNGNFALFSRAVFLSNAPTFTYHGSEDLNGRKTLRYDYTVTTLVSGYSLKINGRSANVGFHGSFWVDPDTLDLRRLEVISHDIPSTLGLQSATTTMDYARIKIGDGEYLLPSGSELSMVHMTGDEDRNRITFTACRQYVGESVITFSEGPLDTATAALPAVATKTKVEVPAGRSFEVSLDTEIDGARSMVGDAVRATLRQAIKVDKRVMFEKGAVLSGRVLRMERRGDTSVIDLEFTEIDSGSEHADIRASIEDALMFTEGAGTGHNPPRLAPRPDERNALMLRNMRLHVPRGARFRLRTR